MRVVSGSDSTTTLSYSPGDQASLVLISQSQGVDHAKAGGRIAFSLPAQELPGVQEKVEQAKEKVLTPLISLDTPGKATVQVATNQIIATLSTDQ